ncbi:hypothetical protein FN846DRAFT_923541 [Sphaerosporella brunnea]|uniref:Uncharacterized protein n=1 Tax=Sphaerosporella brunnea TaxID=1250544 RepID=A0A5J5EDH6_9PEZI|nr:hypothetical protein FN846DRAFT_923541 [Sphaerosporella brunnea]
MPPKSATTKDRSNKNIKVNKGNRSLPPPAEDDYSTECDAILVTRSELGEEEEMKQDAKDAPGQALQEEELHVEDVRGELFVGNRRGLSFANYKVDQADLRARVDAQDKKIASQDIKIGSLEDRVGSLTSSLDAYKLLRHRFISAFKRDKLASATEADKRIIGAGNAWARGGDAVVDALLYTGTGGRTDVKAFQKLYGMSPGDVQMLKHKETINVLNTHAGVVASKHKTGSDKFYKLFAEFVNLFKESGEGYEEGYLNGNPTDVTHAYWAFVNCIKDEVTRVEAAEASD